MGGIMKIQSLSYVLIETTDLQEWANYAQMWSV